MQDPEDPAIDEVEMVVTVNYSPSSRHGCFCRASRGSTFCTGQDDGRRRRSR